jgi:peptidoglycan/LPS O-acetylase OafA/YrhL
VTSQPNTRRSFPALDGVRAIAAYGVIATHVGFNSGRSLDNGPLAPLLSRLDFGVTLFFLLSGFLIYRPFARAALTNTPAPGARRFWWRRTLRIFPAFWLTVVVTLSVLSVRPAHASDWWSYLLLVQTYDHHNVDPGLTQMWTLVVEVSFYAVLPFLAYLARGRWRGAESVARRQLLLVAGLMAISIIANVAAHAGIGQDSLTWLPANMDWFALGMFLALLSCLAPNNLALGSVPAVARDLAGAPGTCWVVGGLLFWLATTPIGGPRFLFVPTAWEWTTKHYLYALAALALLLPLTLSRGGHIGWLLSNRVVAYLGQISYGVYLWHLPVLLAIQRLLHYETFSGHFVELYLFTAAATTAIASCSWHFLEKPLMHYGARFFTDKRREAPQAVSRIAVNTSI